MTECLLLFLLQISVCQKMIRFLKKKTYGCVRNLTLCQTSFVQVQQFTSCVFKTKYQFNLHLAAIFVLLFFYKMALFNVV
jgi:hypothetical protein